MPLASVLNTNNNLQYVSKENQSQRNNWPDIWILHDLSSAMPSGPEVHPGFWREEVVEKENTKPITKHHHCVCHLGGWRWWHVHPRMEVLHPNKGRWVRLFLRTLSIYKAHNQSCTPGPWPCLTPLSDEITGLCNPGLFWILLWIYQQ